MNRNTAQAAFANLAGGTFVGLDSLTTVKLKGGKKNPMQGRVTKLMYDATVMAFSNTNSNAYENMVNRRLQAEGKPAFLVGPRAWGERVDGTPFVEHKGSLYLEVIFMKAAGKTTFFLDGAEIAREDITGLEEAVEGRQGDLENKVIIRTFALDSVVALRANGTEYR
jgi:hypothetical protein